MIIIFVELIVQLIYYPINDASPRIHTLWIVKEAKFLHADNEDSYQTAR